MFLDLPILRMDPFLSWEGERLSLGFGLAAFLRIGFGGCVVMGRPRVASFDRIKLLGRAWKYVARHVPSENSEVFGQERELNRLIVVADR